MFFNPLRIRIISVISSLLLIALFCNTLVAQQKEGDRKVPAGVKKVPVDGTVNGSIKYVVGRRETLYGIAKKFNTTQEEILRLNPSVKGNLIKRTVLTIPGPSVSDQLDQKGGDIKPFTEYRIVKGDNFFQLEKKFGAARTDLEKLNPDLKEGFNLGMTIKIPLKRQGGESANKLVESQLINEVGKPERSPVDANEASFNLNKTFEIGIFLPFCQNLSDSSLIAQRTNSFFEFYSGFLLATGKSTESGMKVKLFVYDTYQDSGVVERQVKKSEFLSLDLVVGPVYPEGQKIVAELCAKNHIPMVSPLSSDSRYVSTTPGYYLVNPGRRIRLAGTADYISGKFADQNIILLNRGTNSGDEKILDDRLTQQLGAGKIRQYNILSGGTAGLEALLKLDKENIIVLAEGNEADVSVAMTRLNTVSKSNKITVIGLQEYAKMQSIDIEYLHNTNLHYLAPYFIDYGNSKVNSFIGKYRSAYNSEPTPFSFQGYDVASYFLGSLLKSGKKFPVTNPNPGVELLQADYSFQKLSDFGGWINRTLYVIEYANSYDIRCDGKIRALIPTDPNGEKQTHTNGLEQ